MLISRRRSSGESFLKWQDRSFRAENEPHLEEGYDCFVSVAASTCLHSRFNTPIEKIHSLIVVLAERNEVWASVPKPCKSGGR